MVSSFFVSFHPFAFTENPVAVITEVEFMDSKKYLTGFSFYSQQLSWSSGQDKTPLMEGEIIFRKMYDW